MSIRVKSKLVHNGYGRIRVIEGWHGLRRLYVKRTNLHTYVVSDSERLSFDSMVEIDGLYHFGTLAELHRALST